MAERGEGYHQRVLAPLVVLRALLSNVNFAIAQIAAIARAEGLAPPGEHDLFFYPGLS